MKTTGRFGIRKAFRTWKDRINSEIQYAIDSWLSPRINSRESVVITGFWRSGTTWLQQVIAELLGAKTIFEPLQPGTMASQTPHPYGRLGEKNPMFLRLYLPFCDVDFGGYEHLQTYLQKALIGDIEGAWVRMLRKNLLDAFKKRIVVKLVRGQFCIGAIRNTFHCPVIHIFRDPRSVIASAKRNGWWQGWLADISLRDQLLLQGDGRETYFSRWQDDIIQYDQENPVSKVAAYWALTEKYVRHASERQSEARMQLVSYDQMLSSTVPKFLGTLLHNIGVTAATTRDINFEKASPTTNDFRRRMRPLDRLHTWKTELERAEIDAIESIVQRFDLADRLTT